MPLHEYGIRRKYCSSQGTHGFHLPTGTSTGTRLGTDHGIRVYCSGLGFPYALVGTCFVEAVSVCVYLRKCTLTLNVYELCVK